MRPHILESFLQAGPEKARWTGYGLALVLGGLWESLSSLLAGALAALFLADLLLGVLKALHHGGLAAFDWTRFTRAWLKLGAAIVGVLVFTLGDMLLHEADLIPTTVNPITSAGLFGMCWGFFWSSVQSLSHFFPDVEMWLDKVLRRPKEGEAPHPLRRATDRPQQDTGP